MTEEDIKFIADILEKSRWLFYGDLEEHFDAFLKKVFSADLKEWGFGDKSMTPDFAVAYWLLISELNALDLIDYGTSPRGAWLSKDGKRFAEIIRNNENAIEKAEDFIYRKYNE